MNPSQQSQGNQRAGRAPPSALSVESPALTQPFKDYVSRGLVELRVTFNPMGTQIACNPLGAIRKAGEDETTSLPWGEIKKRIEDANLNRQKKSNAGKGGQNQALPLKSLSLRDFEGSDENLLQRIRAVATAIGPDVARSRIMTHKLNASGHDSFEVWWTSAGKLDRAALLMDKKHAEETGEEKISKLVDLSYPCPFRGSLSPPQAKAPKTPEAQTNGVDPKAKTTNGKQRADSGGETSKKSPPRK